MTNKQESYSKMSLASVIYLNAKEKITSGLPQFATYFGEIQSANGQIQLELVKQEADNSGDTIAKKQLRETLILQAGDISRRVVAYATNSNNIVLLNLVDYKDSDLKKSSDQKLVSSCRVICENANNCVDSLTEYGVNAAMITNLQNMINDFNYTIPKGRLSKTDSGEATKRLSDLFKTLRTNWAKIDTLVEIVRTSQPHFYNEYTKVRMVIETGRGSLALKVKTINAQSGKPEPNVTLILMPASADLKMITASGKGKIMKKTAKAGGCNYKNIADGTYSIDAKKPGFKVVNETVNVVSGELAVVQIIMEQV